MPVASIPTGTAKVRIWSLANATSGTLKWTVKDGRCPAGSDPSAATLTSETQSSVTWATAGIYVETKVTLTGLSSLAAGDMVVLAITFQTSGTTLAAESVHIVALIWE